MTVTIVETSGSSTANSFLSAAAADTYINTRLNASLWLGAATNDDCKRALIEATRDISLVNTWSGSRVTTTQALSWPRQYAVNPDLPSLINITDIAEMYFGVTVIPQRVKDATCELALEYIRNGTTDISLRDADADKMSKTVDVLRTDFVKPGERPKGLRRYPRVISLLDPLLDPEKTGLTLVRS